MMTKTRPTLKSPCVADTYHGPNERIAEFRFPNGKGGLIAFRQHPELCIVDVYRCDEGIEVRTANPKDWNDPTRTPVPPPREYWAAYAGMANGQSITLHPTRRAALEDIASCFFGDQPSDDPQPEQTDEELAEALQDHCDTSADDWHVMEVQLP